MALLQCEESAFYRCFARIDLSNIEHNFDVLKSKLKPGVKAMAVIKADAYGHGSIPVAKRLENKADYFAVACLEEALCLREAGISTPILILSNIHSAQYRILPEYNLTATVFSVGEARELSKAAQNAGKDIKIHLALDTGMGRIGIFPDKKGLEAAETIYRLPGLEMEGVFSHFARADETDKGATEKQIQIFSDFLSALKERNIQVPIRHICNSAGTMELDQNFDLCRFGIALYGIFPSNEVSREGVDLRPAMSVLSRVIFVKEVLKGTKIGYGHTYHAPENKKIATVSIGYADGFNRALSGVGQVLINGKRASVVGRVCMDLIMVDVTDIENVEVGQLVTVLGKDGQDEITADEWERLFDTSRYEVLTSFSSRVKRIYREEAEPF